MAFVNRRAILAHKYMNTPTHPHTHPPTWIFWQGVEQHVLDAEGFSLLLLLDFGEPVGEECLALGDVGELGLSGRIQDVLKCVGGCVGAWVCLLW